MNKSGDIQLSVQNYMSSQMEDNNEYAEIDLYTIMNPLPLPAAIDSCPAYANITRGQSSSDENANSEAHQYDVIGVQSNPQLKHNGHNISA